MHWGPIAQELGLAAAAVRAPAIVTAATTANIFARNRVHTHATPLGICFSTSFLPSFQYVVGGPRGISSAAFRQARAPPPLWPSTAARGSPEAGGYRTASTLAKPPPPWYADAMRNS
jgi:hypothetical protein